MKSDISPIHESIHIPAGKLLANRVKGSSLLKIGTSRGSTCWGKGSDIERKTGKKFFVNASSSSYSEAQGGGLTSLGRTTVSKRDWQIAVGAALTVVFAVANRVLYKMALVPLKNYPFFLAVMNTFGYVLVYFSILYIRYQAGIVTDEMLGLPKSRFILVGALEALGLALGMTAAAVLPGASLPILVQTFLIWQLAFSIIFLKKRYSFGQIVGCIMVLTGVVIALSSTGNGLAFVDHVSPFWPLLMILSAAFQAGASIIKEFVFRNATVSLKGGSVDIFVVNSFGSGFQALFVLLLLPFLSQLRGIPFSQLPGYMWDGAGCLFNFGTMSTDCHGATLLTFSYVIVNLAFNISVLSLLKMSSAVVCSLCTTLAVPLSIFMFTLPLPYVGTPASLPPQFLVGTATLLGGLAFYNFFDHAKKFIKHQ